MFMRQGVNMRTWPQAETWAPASPRSKTWASKPASIAPSAASRPIGPAPTIARLLRESAVMPATLPEVGDDRGVIGGAARTAQAGNRRAAPALPPASREPVETEMRTALGALEQRLRGRPGERAARLRHARELEVERGFAIHVRLPAEVRGVESIEQRLPRRPVLGP